MLDILHCHLEWICSIVAAILPTPRFLRIFPKRTGGLDGCQQYALGRSPFNNHYLFGFLKNNFRNKEWRYKAL
jgi:hypothetical protein